ncbi:Acidic phosphoprotein precursor PCEMA1, putative, partial [Plasmodium chabaudi adami]
FGCFRKKPKKILAKTVAAPVKAPETADFDPNLPNIKFIEEFEPITIEGCKSRLPELDDLFVSETDGMIIDKVTGFSRSFGCFRKKPKKILAKTVAAPVKAPETADFDPNLPNIKFIEEFEPITIEGCKSRLPELDDLFVSETD